ncbi:MAG: hypothetical protein ACREF3_14140, partial [Acetobacteraceae bacterium]
ALVWAWVAWMPIAFLDPEYPAWLAKEQMLAQCDLGRILVVGDSRAAVDIEPAVLPVPVTNLAVGGGEAIEAFTAVRRALRCGKPPQLVIVSIDAAHFVLPDLFWERSVGFGWLTHRDVDRLARISRRLHDLSIYGMKRSDGLSPRLRAGLYALRFPSLYFASLVHGGVLLRWDRNRHTLARTRASRGQYFYGTADGSSVVAAEGHLSRFAPLPVLDWYFDRMLAMLAARGIPVEFVSMPMNDATWEAVQPDVRAGFIAYLDHYRAKYRNFHVVGDTFPHWPNRMFGDEFLHLNPAGAALFTAIFADWLDGTEMIAAAAPPAVAQFHRAAAPPDESFDHLPLRVTLPVIVRH